MANPSSPTPQFTRSPRSGLPIENTYQIETSTLVNRISLIAIFILAGASIGLSSSGFLGVIIGASVVMALTMTIIAIRKIYTHKFSHYYAMNSSQSAAMAERAPNSDQYNTADVRIIDSAEKSFEWKKKLIQSANHSIEFSLNFGGGEKLQEILDLIEQRMTDKPELKVHLLISEDFLELADMKKLETLAKTHPNNFTFLKTERIFFTKPILHTEENHVKLLIVDEKYFVVGGSGILSRMTCDKYDPNQTDRFSSLASKVIDPSFRDTDLIGCGEEIAVTMRHQFYALFSKWEKRTKDRDEDRFFSLTNDPLTDDLKKGECAEFHDTTNDAENATDRLCEDVRLRSLMASPEHREKNPITEEIVYQIRQSKTSIRFANLLFDPADSIKQALQEKKKQRTGSEAVRIVGNFNGSPSGSSIGHFTFTLPARSNYDLLDEVYEYQGPYQMYHKKVAVFDDYITMIGSYNLGIKSAYYDDEIVCEIQSPEVARLMNLSLNRDQELSRKRTFSPTELVSAKVIGAPAIAVFGPYFG